MKRPAGTRLTARHHRAVALLALSAASSIAAGFSWFTFSGVPIVWFAGTDTRWISEVAFPPGSQADLMIRAAAGAWNITGGSSWTFSAGPANIFPPDQFEGISYTEAVSADSFDDPGTLAVTLLGNINGEWVDMDTLFNAQAPNGWGWNLDPAPTPEMLQNPSLFGFSLLQVAMHEFGHAFGLAHEDTTVAMLNAFYPNGGTFGQANIVEPHADDRLGQRFLYPGGIFTDLGNANFFHSGTGQSALVFFTPTTIDPAGQIAVRLQIENLGTTTLFAVRQGFYLSSDAAISTSDRLIGAIDWQSLDAGASGQFDLVLDIPADVPSGSWFVGSIIDDTGAVTEAFEDNNALVYEEPLTIRLVAPVIQPPSSVNLPCGLAFISTPPALTDPLHNGPVTWSLRIAPSGAAIDPATGVVSWPNPTASNVGHLFTIRATNSAGFDEVSFVLGVAPEPPAILPIADQQVGCGTDFVSPPPALESPECNGDVFGWTLDQAPAGATIDIATGVVRWPDAFHSDAPQPITVRVFTSAGTATTTFTLHVPPADTNGDAIADASDDYLLIAACTAGPGFTAPPTCACADLDSDGDVDLHDYARFQSLLTAAP